MTLLRHILLVAAAALVSWFVLLRTPEGGAIEEAPGENSVLAPDLKLAVRPRTESTPQSSPAEEPAQEREAEPQTVPEEEAQPVPEAAVPEVIEAAPPAPERGAPDGAEDGELPPQTIAASEPVHEESVESKEVEAGPKGSPRARFLEDEELLATARRELSGETRVGFETRILSAPEDQLEISRSFGGEIVLVPRSAIDPSRDPAQAVWFRLKPDASGSPARVERVVGPPELANWTRYRDLFDYEYARLPNEVRDLRRSVLSRAEVFLFAGLISAREWALVVGRRTEALTQAGRRPEELRRATLRTIRTQDGFDFLVESLEYTQDAQN